MFKSKKKEGRKGTERNTEKKNFRGSVLKKYFTRRQFRVEDGREVGEYAEGDLRSARHPSKWFYYTNRNVRANE